MALRSLKQSSRFISNLRNYSSSGLVSVAVHDKTGFATVNLQRPPVNSLNLELLTDLSNTLTELEKNKSRGMILTSTSKSVFSAGLDILEMYKPNLDRTRLFWRTLQDVWIKLYGSPYPTVAAINGHSPAGGCLLAVSCEYRVMLNNFTIGLNETQLGIIAPTWFMATMLNTTSRRETELALTTGRLFSTEEALKIGLIDEVASSKEEAIEKSQQFLERFSRISPFARSTTKRLLRQKDINELVSSRDKDVEMFINAVTQDQVQKGLESYLEALKKKAKSN